MNVYDFDGTIYDGDSGVDIVKYGLKTHTFLVIWTLLKTCFVFLGYIFKKREIVDVKVSALSFLIKINNINEFINDFIKIHKKNIKFWYYKMQREDDIVISASYSLWIKPFCKEIGINNVIATELDLKSGKIIGKNCSMDEKVKLFKKYYKNKKINNFYSDSHNDIPMFEFSENGHVVNEDTITSYNKNSFNDKKKNIFFDRDFLLFIFCGGIGTLTNLILSLIISEYVDSILSYIIGYSCSLFVSYLLNINLIFDKKTKIIDFIKFVISYIPNFTILVSFVYLFINILLWPKALAYGLAAVIGIPITYIFVKIFAFNDNKKKV